MVIEKNKKCNFLKQGHKTHTVHKTFD